MPELALPDSTELDAAGLRVEVEHEVLTISLCRPEHLNPQHPGTWRALAEIGAALPRDIRVVVLRGDGGSFSAGLDRRMFGSGVPGEPSLTEIARQTKDERESTIADFQRGFSWLRDAPAVSVAVVQGHAIGAGFQLALAADLRVIGRDAKFCMKESSFGIVPDLAGTWPLVQAVGYERALEIMATARVVDSDEAARIGLAHSIADDPEAAAHELVRCLLATPRGALAGVKSLSRSAVTNTLHEQLAAERAVQAPLIAALLSAHG